MFNHFWELKGKPKKTESSRFINLFISNFNQDINAGLHIKTTKGAKVLRSELLQCNLSVSLIPE